jgi:hypothetical protein
MDGQLIEETDPQALRARARALTAGHQNVSRSYRDPFAVVAWHARRVGADIERIEAGGPAVRGFAESICTPDELEAVGPRLDDAAFVVGLWSSKEALAKALGDAVRYDPRRLGAPALWPGGIGGRWRARAVRGPAGHVVWLVWEVPAVHRELSGGRRELRL